MNQSVWRASLLALGLTMASFGQAGNAPTKVGIIYIQNAIFQTKDGQKAAAELEAKFGPRRKEFDKRQQELTQLETQYRQGANTMSDEARQKLMRDIDQKRKLLQRDMDDAQGELDQEQGRVLQELGQRMMAVLGKYASDRGFAVVLDVSNPQTPVLWASNTIDITQEVVELYDKGAAGQAPSGATATPPPTAAPKPVAPKPAAPPKK